MEDIEGNEIEGAYDIGTRKYNIKINNRYLVDFKERKNNKGKGSCSNNVLVGLNAIYDPDIIIVSDKKEDAMLFDGRINMISTIEKILKNYGYLFYKIEIIEIED
jgi:hypothetical protein